MTFLQSCWSLYFLLANTDVHSDSGHQSFSLLWATMRAIRRFSFKFELAHKILTLSYQQCQSCISCLRRCVCQLCGMWVWLAIRLSRVRSSCPAPSYCWYWSFPFLLIERRTVVSYWQNPTPGPFVSIRWEHLGIISLPWPPINWAII